MTLRSGLYVGSVFHRGSRQSGTGFATDCSGF
jgi:hypothetical protein